MVVNLKYDNYMDSLSKDDLSTHIVNKLVLSWKTFGLKDITADMIEIIANFIFILSILNVYS